MGSPYSSAGGTASISDPPLNWASATVSDTVTDPATGAQGYFRAIYCGSTGDIKVHTLGGQDVIFKSVPTGQMLIGCFTRVWSNGTAASSLLIGW